MIRQAGRAAAVLDVEAFALANAYQMNYPERSTRSPLLIHVGHSATIVCLLEHGQLAFTRDIALGGRLYIETLQRELGVDAMTAEHIQRGHVPTRSQPRTGRRPAARHERQLVLEIRKTVDFYRATAPIETAQPRRAVGRRLRSRGPRRAARRGVWRAGRACSIRSASVDRPKRARPAHAISRPVRPMRSPWVWRCAGRATDDSRSICSRRAGRPSGRGA